MIDIRNVIVAFIVVSILSYVVTYYFAITLRLGWYELLGIFSVLLFASRALVHWFFPLQVLQKLIKQLDFVSVFGIALYGISSGFINVYMLYKRFGLMDAALLTIVSSLIANGAYDIVVAPAFAAK